MPTKGGFLKSVLGAFVLAALAVGTANAADGKGEPEKGKARTFKTKVINAPELAGMPKSAVLEALGAFEADRKAGRIAKGDEERVLRDRMERAFRLNRSGEGLQKKQSATGGSNVDLEGRFEYVMLSRTEADGTTTVECVSDAGAAVAFLMGRSRAAAEKE